MRMIDRMHRFYGVFFGDLSEAIDEHYLKEGWQLNASLESLKPITSTLHWPKEGKVNARARFIGGLLGHSVSHYEALCQPETWKVVSHWIAVIEDLTARISGNPKEESTSQDSNPFLDHRRSFQSAVGQCVRIASKQSPEEQIQFFEGYAKALRRGSLTVDARPVAETTRTTAFQVIALFGPVLSLHVRSVADVHRFLEKCLGANRAGGLKRTEEICKALGMKFRGSGRPGRDPKLQP